MVPVPPAPSEHRPDPDPGDRRRSAPTRRAILEAARSQFARYGYERATVRSIAAEARIDPSMVMRYFGSKEGLFSAASSIELSLPDLSAVPSEDLGSVLMRHFLERWEQPAVDDALVFLLRAAATNEAAAEQMRSIFTSQVATALSVLAQGDTALRSGLVATQVIGLAMCRYVLRLEPVVNASPESLVAAVAPTLQRYLVGPLP